MIEFVRLIQQGDDEKFRNEIASYLDVDRFLRFMAVQAMIANADGFFTLGYNYALFLDPKTNRFVFIPGDQELSFANFGMMGSADQLMDMSLARPYGGENRLVDRLLAVKEVREAYRKVLKRASRRRSSARTVFWPMPPQSRARRRRSSSVRRRHGPSGRSRRVGFGPPGGPTAPDLRTFADKRTASIADQTRGQEGRLSPAVQLWAAGRESDRSRRSTTRRSAKSSRPRRGSRSACSRPRRRWDTR